MAEETSNDELMEAGKKCLKEQGINLDGEQSPELTPEQLESLDEDLNQCLEETLQREAPELMASDSKALLDKLTGIEDINEWKAAVDKEMARWDASFEALEDTGRLDTEILEGSKNLNNIFTATWKGDIASHYLEQGDFDRVEYIHNKLVDVQMRSIIRLEKANEELLQRHGFESVEQFEARDTPEQLPPASTPPSQDKPSSIHMK